MKHPGTTWRRRRSRRSRKDTSCNVRTIVHTIAEKRTRLRERFERDRAKEALNWGKHGVRFGDAVGVFDDEQALSMEDPDAQGEQRFVATGIDFTGQLATVVYTFRADRVRLISARPASGRERRVYERGGS